MKQTAVSERGACLNKLPIVSPQAEYHLNVVLVYQDDLTHSWATEVFEHLVGLVGRDCLRATWWRVADLAQPGVLAGAVSTAMRADVVAVAIDATEGLPLPFHFWVNTWLPNRFQPSGCFVALLGPPARIDSRSRKTGEFLRAVALQGGFDFVLENRPTPSELIAFPRQDLWARGRSEALRPGRRTPNRQRETAVRARIPALVSSAR